jgi:CheY-specific phosphatase CheX
MNSESLAILDAIISEATHSLFEVSGMKLISGENLPADHDHTFAATIGFTNPRFRGMLVLTTDRHMVTRSRPTELQANTPSEKELDDWVGELVNQLIGRIKNQLIRHHIDMELSIPSVVRGRWLRRALPDASISRQMIFVHDIGSVYICFDAMVPEELELEEGADASEGVTEGEVTLF